jgi:hypothetical protein
VGSASSGASLAEVTARVDEHLFPFYSRPSAHRLHPDRSNSDGGGRRGEQIRPNPRVATPITTLFLLLLSIPTVFLLAPRLIPPQTLPAIQDAHGTEDLALFPRARILLVLPVFVQACPKVAFLFLTNSEFVFAPLWEFFVRHRGSSPSPPRHPSMAASSRGRPRSAPSPGSSPPRAASFFTRGRAW